MIGQKIKSIYVSKISDAWTCIETDSAFYEIRVGGIRKISDVLIDNYELFESPKIGLLVIEVWTDGETIYIELEDDSYIALGFLTVDSEGVSHRSIYYINEGDLDDDEKDFEKDPLMRKIR